MSGPCRAWASRFSGLYARSLYLPVTILGQALRRQSRRIRGVERGQKTRLPIVSWRDLLPSKSIHIVQARKNAGDVNLGELAVLASAAAATRSGAEIIEIGTFDGRTTLNFAMNAPAHLHIFTLDLPSNVPSKFELVPGERAFIDKPESGRLFREAPPQWEFAGRIKLLLGDSATFDWSGHFGRAGLVFVDGSHAYDYVVADSKVAFRLVASKGMVFWHDYGVWEGVTRALEQLEASRHLGLRHVRGTSLVVWRAGDLGDAGPQGL
jgi:Methyltransferase domain